MKIFEWPRFRILVKFAPAEKSLHFAFWFTVFRGFLRFPVELHFDELKILDFVAFRYADHVGTGLHVRKVNYQTFPPNR